MSDEKPDPWANFPGGNPFGPNGPFGGGRDPLGNMDEWFRSMGIDPRDFQRLFDDMQRNLQDAFKGMSEDPSKGFMAGFNVRMGPDGKPSINTFGNKPNVRRDGPIPTIGTDEREPLTDVIEDPTGVAITMELPGVDKTDVKVNMTSESLEVNVDTETRKYSKRVKLPCKVDATTTKATYTNGVLDVTVKKAAPGEDGVPIAVE